MHDVLGMRLNKMQVGPGSRGSRPSQALVEDSAESVGEDFHSLREGWLSVEDSHALSAQVLLSRGSS